MCAEMLTSTETGGGDPGLGPGYRRPVVVRHHGVIFVYDGLNFCAISGEAARTYAGPHTDPGNPPFPLPLLFPPFPNLGAKEYPISEKPIIVIGFWRKFGVASLAYGV